MNKKHKRSIAVLRLCPFCGREPIRFVYICDSAITCSCGARMVVNNPKYPKTAERLVTKLWNTRIADNKEVK